MSRHSNDSPSESQPKELLAREAPDCDLFIPDDDECLVFCPDEDPLGDFGLDDEEQYPDERDYWVERDDD